MIAALLANAHALPVGVKVLIALVIAGVVVPLRIARYRRRRARRTGAGAPATAPAERPRTTRRSVLERVVSRDVALVASREVRERLRGRLFKVGTLVVLAVVAGAILIPRFTSGKATPPRVGVVGGLSAEVRAAVVSASRSAGTAASLVSEPSEAAARAALERGSVDLAVIDARLVLVKTALTTSDASTAAAVARGVATYLGDANALASAHLTPQQAAALRGAMAVPITGLHPSKRHRTLADATTLMGIILIFIVLQQYNNWIIFGVMEEKGSRVVEVLLSTVRPLRLLTGKVLGIGLVALLQAAIILAFALALAGAVGSTILHGAQPLHLLGIFVWLILGYAFYCWVYAAAGSMIERQDQVQAASFPLAVPLTVGYISAIIALSGTSVSLYSQILAYLPPTAPFMMPALVGLGAVTWWQFLASALLCIAATVLLARGAGVVYRRSILRTGTRVRIREVLARSA